MQNLIADEKIVFESPDPESVFCYTPALLPAEGGRLVASFDLGGPGTVKLDGPRSDHGDYPTGNQLRFLISDDHGENWREGARLPMLHAMLFKGKDALWCIGHSGRLLISRSTDNGESWSEPSILDDSHLWHQSAGHIDIHDGKIYLVYEQRIEGRPWPGVAPVLMSAKVDADLRDRKNWTFSEPFDGAPLFAEDTLNGIPLAPGCEPGILETNVVRIVNPGNFFYDETGNSVLLFLRQNGGLPNMGAVLRGIEAPDGSLRIVPLENPASRRTFLVPMPGGQLKFYLDYDPVSRLYWLLSSQTTGYMSEERYLPRGYSGRCRLQLHYSVNAFDWCYAGMVAMAPGEPASRHYASFVFDGEDMLVLSRSGDRRAKSAHDGNLITFHRVRAFRSLVF